MAEPVTCAYVHQHEVAYSWHASLMGLFGYDLANRQRIVRGGTIAVRYGTGGIVAARNSAVERFLESDTPWLWWVDTDMGFGPDTVDRLVAAAGDVDGSVVGGLAFAQREVAPDGFGGWKVSATPTLYDWHVRDDGQAGFAARYGYERDTVQKVAATGSACILIHRDVFIKIGSGWYDPVVNPTDGRLLGEDMSFCVRTIEAGFDVWVDTSVKTTHLKSVWLGEEAADG